MKRIFILLLYFSPLCAAFSQNSVTDSLKRILAQTQQDTSKVLLLTDLAASYQFLKSDTAIVLAKKAIMLAQKLHFAKGEVLARIRLGEVMRLRGEFPQALQEEMKALQLSRKTGDVESEAQYFIFAAPVYTDLGEYQKGLDHLFQAKKIYEHIGQPVPAFVLTNIGDAYERINKLDSALYFQQQALISSQSERSYLHSLPLRALILHRFGIIQNRLGNRQEAFKYYRQSLQTASISGDLLNQARSLYLIAELYHLLNQRDSGLWYARLAFEVAQRARHKTTLLNTSSLLAKLYKENKNSDSALLYEEMTMAVKDTLFGQEKLRQLQLLTLSEQQHIQQLRDQQARLQRTILVSALSIFLLIALLLWRNIGQRKKAYLLLQNQKRETDQQRTIVEQTLEELKSAQVQLIQSEKMASLGELTAGIAHEIQNPLNFVNNFSEVNTELIDELEHEADKGNIDEVKSIANDIKENEQKINLHGKRADAIVKSMLEHSRASKGPKEPTDINALADEYLRLSYHGFRAKDKSFKARIETHFDESIDKIEVVPQDIGRVLLNLFNNAFYAVNEKKKQLGEAYAPTVLVSTKKLGKKVEIRVHDNGKGIPQKVVDKIFQPFFTTKPTGEGTGLGLSLSYDIIKAHGGELKVETKEGAFAEFMIQMPVG